MALSFDKIKDLIGINGTVGVDLLGSARVRDNLFVSGYLTVGGKKFTGLNINGVKAIDQDVKWKGETIEVEKGGTGEAVDTSWKNDFVTWDQVTDNESIKDIPENGATKGGDWETDIDNRPTALIDIETDGSLDVSGGTFTTSAAQNLAIVQGVGANTDIGDFDFRANTLTADGQTSGSVAIYGTNGLLSEDPDLLFSGSELTIGIDADGADRSIVWGHTTLKTIMGIDDSADAFVINTDAAFDGTLANNSFSIDASHNVIIAGDVTVGDDLFLSSSGSIVNWNAGDITLTHSSGKLTLSGDGTVEIDFDDNEMTNVDIDSGAIDGVTLGTNSAVTQAQIDNININGNIINATSGDLTITAAGGDISFGDERLATTGTLGSGAITASGIIKTDDTTEATSTTDGSLQTDGGLSVVKSAVIGDDLDLLSDSCVLNIGNTSKFTLTDQGADNCVMASSGHRLAFGDAGEYIYGDGTDMKIISSGDVDITTTLVDITGALTASGTLTLGADDDGDSTIKRKTHSDEAGGKLLIKGGNGTGTNKAGGNLEIFAGASTGSAASGDIIFKVAGQASGSDILNSYTTALTIDQLHDSTFAGDVVLQGGDGALSFEVAGKNSIHLVDNQAEALVIENSVGGSDFMIFTTTNSGEKITSNKDFYVSEIRDVSSIYAETEADMNFYLRYDDAGSSGDVAFQFYDYNTNFLDITYTSNLAIIKTSGSGVNLEINSRGGDITFKDDSTSSMIFDMNTTAGATYIQNGAGNAVVAIDDGDQRLYFYDKGGEYIVGDGTDITIASGGGIVLSAVGDQITMDDGTTTRFEFNVDSTPELDVTGNFILDGSATITLDSVGNFIVKTDASQRFKVDTGGHAYFHNFEGTFTGGEALFNDYKINNLADNYHFVTAFDDLKQNYVLLAEDTESAAGTFNPGYGS